MLGLLTNSPIFLYVKIALAVAVVAGAGYIAWSVRGAYAEQEVAEAVNGAVAEMQTQLAEERALRAQVEQAADERHAALLQSISILEETQRTSTVRVTVERKSNPKFYSQPLPEKGLEEWTRARALIGAASPSSSASAASSSSP